MRIFNLKESYNTLLSNIFFSFIQYVLSGLYPLIIILFISTRLSVEVWGELTLIQATAVILSLVIIFGTDSFGMRKIPRQNKNKKLIFNVIIQVYLVRLINFFIVSILLCFLIGKFDLLTIFSILFWSFSIIISPLWAFIALDNTKSFVYLELIIRLISLFLLFFFITDDEYKFSYIIIISSSNIVFSVLGIIQLVRKYYTFNFPEMKEYIINAYKESFPFFNIQILNNSYIMLPVILVGSILGTSEAANYGNAEKFQRLFRSLISPFGRVLLSFNSKKTVKKDKLIRLWPYVGMIGITIFIVGLIMSTTFFDLFFDDDYESMKQIAIIMFASIPFIYVSSHLINTFIYPFNNEYFLNKVMLIIAPIVVMVLLVFMNSEYLIFTSFVGLIAEIILCLTLVLFLKFYKKKKK